MENKLTTSTRNQSIALLPKAEVNKTLFRINSLTPFPINDDQIDDWNTDIKKLSPNTTLDEISSIIDMFQQNILIWDNRAGIQNIFSGIKHLQDLKHKKHRDHINQLKIEAFEAGFSFEEYLKLYNEHNPK